MTRNWVRNMANINEHYAIFVGSLNQGSSARLMHFLALLSQDQATRVHMLFHSDGGAVGDGVCLYNYFQRLPFELWLYNCGTVSSIATITYLGAHRRLASPHSTFMIHRTFGTVHAASAERLQAVAQGFVLDDARTERVLKDHVRLSESQWTTHAIADLWFSADEAVKVGIAQEIGHFAPPKGTQIHSTI